MLGPSGLAEPVVRPTELSGAEALVNQLVQLVGEAAVDIELEGIGVGVPSVVEFATGRIVASTNVPLKDVALRRVLGERLGVPVFVDNDATVAALAEAHDEQLIQVAANLVMITVGTGVGGGIVLGGRIFRGATGGAGEIGHTIVGLDLTADVPPPGAFPQPASLESAAAGRALDRMASAATGTDMLGADAVAGAQRGDPVTGDAVRRWAGFVGIGIANAINTFDPDEVVIGGGAALAGELLLGPATEVARAYTAPGLGAGTTIRLARHGVRAGVLGAALLAVHEMREDALAPGPPTPTEGALAPTTTEEASP